MARVTTLTQTCNKFLYTNIFDKSYSFIKFVNFNVIGCNGCKEHTGSLAEVLRSWLNEERVREEEELGAPSRTRLAKSMQRCIKDNRNKTTFCETPT